MSQLSKTAFVGGSVWTAGYDHPRPLDVLIEDGRIVDVAPRSRLDCSDAWLQHIPGRLLLPGFQDAHLHLGSGGFDALTLDLTAAGTAEEVFTRVVEYAESLPIDAWVIGGGWDRALFPPTGPGREQLDRLVGGRPAVIASFDRHGAWVSSKALEAAGVASQTVDPVNGFFSRDEEGDLTGMVEEAALSVVRAAMPEPSTRHVQEAVLMAQDLILPLGITSVQDALVGTGLGMVDQLEALGELAAEALKMRLTAALWWDPYRGIEQIRDLIDRRRFLESRTNADRVLADTVKVMVDGSDTVFLSREEIRAATVALDLAGFTVHYHSYGDASTHSVLDAIEAALEHNGPGPRRHHIAHLFSVALDDLARFSALGVTANVQGFWAGSAVPHEHLRGSTMTTDPEDREYPFGRLVAAGTRLAAGSDWPVTTADPLQAIRSATGFLEGFDGRTALDERDRLDLPCMLTAYTAGSAHVNGRGDRTGRIAPGYLADLVLLDQDLFGGPDALAQARVEEVWINGQLESGK